MRTRSAVALITIAACGGRTGLRDTPVDGGVNEVDAAIADTGHDVHVADSGSACSYEGDPSPGAVQSYGACGDGVNIAAPPSNTCGGEGAAFEYVPEIDVAIERIELHTEAATIGLLDSDPECDRPGAVLFLAQADSEGATLDWRGAFVNPPIGVKAGHKYFVYQAPANGHSSTACSVAQSGVDVREYTSPGPNGPWAGPFGGLAWSARLDGVCP